MVKRMPHVCSLPCSTSLLLLSSCAAEPEDQAYNVLGSSSCAGRCPIACSFHHAHNMWWTAEGVQQLQQHTLVMLYVVVSGIPSAIVFWRRLCAQATAVSRAACALHQHYMMVCPEQLAPSLHMLTRSVMTCSWQAQTVCSCRAIADHKAMWATGRGAF